MPKPKIQASSRYRYRASAAERREYGGATIGQLPDQIVRLFRAAGLNSHQAEINLNAARQAGASVDEQNRLFLQLDRSRRVEAGQTYSAAEAQVELDVANARSAAPDVITTYRDRRAAVAPPPLPGVPVAQRRDEVATPPIVGPDGTVKPAPQSRPLVGAALVGIPLALAYAFVRLREQ